MSVGLSKIFQFFHGCFRTKTHHVHGKALSYLMGLFKSEKNRANCQSIADGLGELDHQSLNHLLTDSPWEHSDVFGQLSTSVNALMNDREPVAFLIDEVGFRKKGKFSACVGRQYLGSIGKQDNGQVAVVGGLSQGVHYCPIVAELFMPESWEDDTERRKKAGIPDGVVHSTKPEMALKMILEQREKGTHFDFVGFDALYGSSMAIVSSLVANGISFLGDIKENMHAFLEEPSFGFPTPIKGKRGRKRKHPKTDSASISVRDIKAGLKDEDWTSLTFRSGTKKPIKAMFYSHKVWIHVDSKTIPLILLVRKDPDGKTKYSFTNMDDIGLLELAQRQGQRVFVEKIFEEGKNQVGLGDYQVRSWNGFHKHMALSFIALYYIFHQKITYQEELPLTAPVIRKLVAASIISKWDKADSAIELALKKLKRYFNNDLAKSHQAFIT